MNSPASMFIETQAYHLFQEFCDACRRDAYIGLCYGTAGVGKTVSARYYTDPGNVDSITHYPPSQGMLEKGPSTKVALYTPAVVNSPGHISRDIGGCRDDFNAPLLNRLYRAEKTRLKELEDNMHAKREEIYGKSASVDEERAAEFRRERDAYFAERKSYRSRRREIREDPILVIIDEADRLKMASLEQLRAIFDQGGMGLVLIGMPGLEKRLARYPQLYSRVGFVHEFRALAEMELLSLLRQGWKPPGVVLPDDGMSDEAALAAILRVTDGNFRLLNRLLTQIARVLTINNLRQVTPAVVEVARESLVIGTA